MSGSPLGHPVELLPTGGQAADVKQADTVLAGHRPAAVIADAGYDSDAPVAAIQARGAEPVVEPDRCRKAPRRVGWRLDRERNMVERFGSKVKPYRRVATRYDTKAANVPAFVQVAAVTVMLT